MIAMLLGMAVIMVMAHEAGHVLAAVALGGRWLGTEFRGFRIGVRLSVDSLSPRQVACTLAAGPVSELLIAVAAILIWTADFHWWLLLLGVEWVFNLVPWRVVPNDGTRLWHLWRNTRDVARGASTISPP